MQASLEDFMENQAHAAPTSQGEAPQPHALDNDTNNPAPVERFLIPPKEFIRAVYLTSLGVVVMLSLAIWLMMSLA